jgi:bifunctional enzyme CysN/CysC
VHGEGRQSDRQSGVVRAGVTVWLTGLSGAGKSTIAEAAVARLRELGVAATVLDGDVLRGGLNRDLGFSPEARAEAVRRAGEAALLLSTSGVTAVAALISPYRADRDRVRARHREAGIPFLEVFVDAPVEVTAARDPKGLYARARAGEIPAFTGVSDPYEAPAAPELHLRTDGVSAESCVRSLVERIVAAGGFPVSAAH